MLKLLYCRIKSKRIAEQIFVLFRLKQKTKCFNHKKCKRLHYIPDPASKRCCLQNTDLSLNIFQNVSVSMLSTNFIISSTDWHCVDHRVLTSLIYFVFVLWTPYIAAGFWYAVKRGPRSWEGAPLEHSVLFSTHDIHSTNCNRKNKYKCTNTSYSVFYCKYFCIKLKRLCQNSV